MVKKVHNDREGVSPMKDSQSNGMSGINPYVDGDVQFLIYVETKHGSTN